MNHLELKPSLEDDANPVFPFRQLLPIAFATSLAIFAMGIIIPLMPFYVTTMGGSDANAPYIYSVFSLAALIAAPFWGNLSDRYGRKNILMISLMGTVASYLWLALASDLWQLYGARVLAGITAGWMATSQAYIADVTLTKHRAKGMGLMGAAFGIGFTLGPALGGILFSGKLEKFLTPHDFLIPCLISMALSLFALGMIALVLQEPNHHNQDLQKKKILETYGFWANWFSPVLYKSPILMKYLGLYFCVFLVFTSIEGIFAIWSATILNYGPSQVGMVLAYGGLITIFIQGGLIGKLTQKYGEAKVVMVAILCLMIALALLIATHSMMVLLLAMSFLSLAMGLHNPAMQSLISKSAPPEHQGLILGNAQSAMSFARVLGPAWGALSFGAFTAQTPHWIGLIFLTMVFPVAYFMVFRKSI